jgi:flagellar hook-associated protein 3 FlgL
MVTGNAIKNIADSREKISSLQSKLASTKQFQVASEDPGRASTSLSLRSRLQTIESYADATTTTENWMTANDNAFDQLEQIAARANTLILSGLNDTLSGADRSALNSEMQSLVSRAIETGNSSVNGQYIFSGYQINQKAFALSDSPTILTDYQGNTFTPQVVSYLGDTGTIQRSLGPDQSVPLNVRGDQSILGFVQNLILASNALVQNNIQKTGDPLTDPLTLESTLSGVQSSLDTLTQYRASNGTRMRQVEAAASFLYAIKIETKSLLSANEDMNMAEGIALLANQQTTYEAVLEVSQRAISALSLFDYLR